MITLKGKYFIVGRSEAYTTSAEFSPTTGLELFIEEEKLTYNESEFNVEAELGQTPRIIRFNDGSVFETSDFDNFRSLEKLLKANPITSKLKRIEEHWRTAILSVLTVFLFCFLFYLYGIPQIASTIADVVPQSLRVKMSKDTIALMKKTTILKESKIELERRNYLKELFESALTDSNIPINGEFEYKLTFTNAPLMGQNAFALPSGEIVMTDELVEACNDSQIRAILLHEIGHVELQHGIRSVIQDAGIVIIVSLAIGDANGVSSLVSSLPALLAESHYSQKFEIEADTFSCLELQKQGSSPEHLAEALKILHSQSEEMSMESLISTHPSLKQRLANINRNNSEPTLIETN